MTIPSFYFGRELSIDESFEYVEYPPENAHLLDTNSPPTDHSSFEEISIPKSSHTEGPSSPVGSELPAGMDHVRTRARPLTEEDFKLLLDEDGRLVDEHALRRAVFMGKDNYCFKSFILGTLIVNWCLGGQVVKSMGL